MHIHEPCELVQIITFQSSLTLPTQFFDEVKIIQHLCITASTLFVLLAQYVRRGPRIAGKKQEKIVLKVEQGLFGNL